MQIFLNHYNARKILFGALTNKREITVSLDLGKSLHKVILKKDTWIFEELEFSYEDLYKISYDLYNLYYFDENKNTFKKIEIYNENYGIKINLINNGEFDYPNYSISGKKLYMYKKPIKESISLLFKKYKKYFSNKKGIIYSIKGGYIIKDFIYFFQPKDLFIIRSEYDTLLKPLVDKNPWTTDLYDNIKKYYILEDLESIDEKVDFVIYDPYPFTKYKTYDYSSNRLCILKDILKNEGILFFFFTSFSKSLNKNKIYESLRNKLKVLNFKILCHEPLYNLLICSKCK